MTAIARDEIHLAGAPDIPGLRFRHHRGPEDYPGMVTANQATRDHAGSLELITVDSMTRDYAHLVNCDPHDDFLIVELDGTIVGYARTEWRELTAGGRQFTTIGLLVPEQRGRGIGGAMLDWAEGRLAQVAASLPPDPRSLMRVWNWDTDVHATELYEERGWTLDGRGYEMVRPTLDDIPTVLLPDGFEVRPIGAADRRRVWDATMDAFRDHRAEEEWTEEDWRRDEADPFQDPTLWAVAFAGADIAAGVYGRIDPDENLHHGVQRGYIDGVWTRKPYRRRGLARALLAQVLVILRDRGMTSAYLGVDGINPNQAMHLYESLGFEIRTAESDWTKRLPNVAATPEDDR
jgi:mycothiol synthase